MLWMAPMITDAMVRAAQSTLRNVRYGLSDNEMKLALDAALSSAHPALAQEVEVKPLIWAWNDFLDAWEADTAIGRYQAWQINNVGVVKFPHAADGRIVDGAIDAAKAAAQQDYESRIRSAIVSPATDKLALAREALRHCREIFQSYEINRIDGEEIADEALAKIDAALSTIEESDHG